MPMAELVVNIVPLRAKISERMERQSAPRGLKSNLFFLNGYFD
jgi:hypothetical protein